MLLQDFRNLISQKNCEIKYSKSGKFTILDNPKK